MPIDDLIKLKFFIKTFQDSTCMYIDNDFTKEQLQEFVISSYNQSDLFLSLINQLIDKIEDK